MSLALSISLFGCGGGGGTAVPIISSTTGKLKVVNRTSYAVNEVYVSLSTNTTAWGVQQNTNPIPKGSSWTLTNITTDTYDAKAVIVGSVSTYYVMLIFGASRAQPAKHYSSDGGVSQPQLDSAAFAETAQKAPAANESIAATVQGTTESSVQMTSRNSSALKKEASSENIKQEHYKSQ